MPPTDQEGKARKPQRIQRRRVKGWKAPENTLMATRPSEFGNPFKVGGWYRLGNGGSGFSWLESYAPQHGDPTYTLITTPDAAVRMFREYRKRYPFKPEQIAKLKTADNIACYCPLDQPCHVDVLLEIANG